MNNQKRYIDEDRRKYNPKKNPQIIQGKQTIIYKTLHRKLRLLLCSIFNSNG